MIMSYFSHTKVFFFIFLYALCHQSKAMDSIKKMDTPRLQELATLIYEQQFFLECVDGALNNKYAISQMNGAVSWELLEAYDQAHDELKNSEARAIEQEDRVGNHNGHYCLVLSHLLSHLKTIPAYKSVVANVENFKNEKLLSPLRELMDILKVYEPMQAVDPKFEEIHNDLFMRFYPLCDQYVAQLLEMKHYYDAILDELLHHRERIHIPLRGHYYLQKKLPETLHMSSVYTNIFEQQSKAVIDELLSDIKKPQQTQPIAASQQATSKPHQNQKKLKSKKKSSLIDPSPAPSIAQPIEIHEEQVPQQPKPKESKPLTPDEQNNLMMKNVYAAFEFQDAWMQKLWTAATTPSQKTKPLLDKICKIYESDARLKHVFNVEATDSAESLGDLRHMHQILSAIKQPKSDAQYRQIINAINAWHEEWEESKKIEEIGQRLGKSIKACLNHLYAKKMEGLS